MGYEKFKIRNTKLNGRKVKILRLPMTKKDALDLHVGDIVSIQGLLITGRDKLHTYLFNERPPKERIPFNLEGSILYHCGPIMQKTRQGYQCVASGPTTSMRVEQYVSSVIADYGIRGVMGKGGMGGQTLGALKKFGCVYLHTIGGAAVYLADRVKRVSGVWKLEALGMTEAMWILEVNDLPAIVTMDSYGKSLHDEIEMRSRKILKKLLGSNRF